MNLKPENTPEIDPGIPILSDEQRKRLELVEQYEKDTAETRTLWNDTLGDHEREYQKKWLELRSDIELKRAEAYERLRGQGLEEQQVSSMVAVEMATLTERHLVEKDNAARALGLAAPQSWADWLGEKKQQHPDDPTFDSLIEEAKKTPAIDGYLKTPPPRSVVTELVPRPGADGRVDYIRGMLVAVSDVGPRLDVKRNDERDIEAALKIAAQKFDKEAGLMLTGDLSFKRQAAEIAGRLGLKLQNEEPEVLMAYKRGIEQSQKPQLIQNPEIANGIEGEELGKAVAVLKGPMILKADAHTLETLKKRGIDGVEIDSDETIVMPGERAWKAQKEIRELPMELLPILAEIDVEKEDGGLKKEQIELLERENQGLIQSGKLTQKAIDVVLVRDDRVIRTREKMTQEEREVFGLAYRTAGERMKERDEKEKERELNQGKTPEQIAKEKKGQENKQEPREEEKEREKKEEEIALPLISHALRRSRKTETELVR